MAEEPVPYELPVWPKVVGIISICIGGFMSTCGACGVVGTLTQGNRQMPEGMTPPPQQPPIAILLQVVGFGLAILLLAAGIMLVMRKNAGRVTHVVYAALAIPTGILGFIIQMGMMGSMHQWIQENPKLGKMSDFVMIGVYFGFALGALLMAYNVFLLVWFGVIKRKADLGGTTPEELDLPPG